MSALSHSVTAECAVPARRAYAFLSDGLEVGRWALGSFAARRVGRNLFRGRSLFDGGEVLYRPVGDAARLIVDYHVGADARALSPRVMARVVPGEATGRGRDSCLVTLVAWRDASMTDARWDRLVACHEVEIRLIQAQLGPRGQRSTSPTVGRRRLGAGAPTATRTEP
ncbi:MAG: hypothetical protein ABW020_11380 [Candidatus Rokuibacteriota bacterium]